MIVYIAEKPSLGAAIAQGIPGPKQKHQGHISVGNDQIVTWCFGHIFELFEPQEYSESWKVWRMADLPIVPKEWKVNPKSDAKDQIKIIKELIGKASVVVNAGDPDREGQLIVDEVLEELKCKKPVKRLWVNALDEKSVQKALASMKDNREFQNLKDSAQARSWGDWLVGMNATRKMTLLARDAGVDGTFSVGRVQTPTLALIVGRDLAIENFKSKDFYAVRAQIAADGKNFWARWVPGDAVTLDESGRLLDRSVADSIAGKISGKPAVVTRFDAKEKSEAQPLAFSLDRLQTECNKRFGLSVQQTLDIAQELYEEKLTSYPRTDCGFLPESQHEEAGAILNGLSGLYPDEVSKADKSIKSATWNDKKVAASSHHGIIPTGVCADLNGRKKDVFDLIARRYLAQFYPPFRFQETVIELLGEGEKLTAKGRVQLALGWKVLMQADPGDEEEGNGADEKVSLPSLKEGQSTQCDKAEVEAKKTTPPARFEEGTLVQAMKQVHLFESDPEVKKRLKESSGLGTDATRANIIETLKKRGFIEEKKTKKLVSSLVSTEKGRQLISVLPTHMKSPGLTAVFEDMLDSISKGEVSKWDFLEKQTTMIREFVESALSQPLKAAGPIHNCPQCKEGQLRKRNGSNGAFWGCNKYPDCKATFPDANGTPNLLQKPKAAVSEVEKCKNCGKGLVRRSGSRGFFWGCSGYPSCKTLYQDQAGKPKYA